MLFSSVDIANGSSRWLSRHVAPPVAIDVESPVFICETDDLGIFGDVSIADTVAKEVSYSYEIEYNDSVDLE